MEHLNPLLDVVREFYQASAEFLSAEQHCGYRARSDLDPIRKDQIGNSVLPAELTQIAGGRKLKEFATVGKVLVLNPTLGSHTYQVE